MTNTLAYCCAELTTAIKSLVIKAPEGLKKFYLCNSRNHSNKLFLQNLVMIYGILKIILKSYLKLNDGGRGEGVRLNIKRIDLESLK